MKIKVEYPITETVVIKTASEMKALGYKYKPLCHYLPVNRTFSVWVKTNKKPLTCEELNGISASEYQSKHGVAWNE